MNIELSRFRVLRGMEARAIEWMQTLNARMSEVLQTLERESMKLEIIFREELEGYMYLYWFSIRGESDAQLTESEFDIDKVHLKYWLECIDPEYREVRLEDVVRMIPMSMQAALYS